MSDKYLSSGCNYDCDQGRRCDCGDRSMEMLSGVILTLVVVALTTLVMWVWWLP